MTGRPKDLRVDRYLDGSPASSRAKLREVRRIIRAVVPDAEEVFSYGMPGYSYPGHRAKGMIAWFGLWNSYIGLYVRPPTVHVHQNILKGYVTTKSAVHIPLDQPVPTHLIQALVRTSAEVVRAS